MADIIQGRESFDFLKKCAAEYQPMDVDVVLVCATADEPAAEYVAKTVDQIWQGALQGASTGSIVVSDLVRAITEFANEKMSTSAHPKSCLLFPSLGGRCKECCSSSPPLKMAILDASYLWIEDFLEDVANLVRSTRVMLIPVLTNKFLTQPELLIRTYYLKLAGGFSKNSNYVTPAYVETLRVQNYLFDCYRGIRLCRISRWGTVLPGMIPATEIAMMTTFLEFFVEKIHDRRRFCQHRQCLRETDESGVCENGDSGNATAN